ncbi:hypothetical protein C7I55_19520 [Sphingomonas deserti]|uniref:Uncharacterized protein n=1 Tax=Allosphingosinicella deserti TaxID=2116704 RepID=A0A2P7QIW8_9SPHN|nr:hypothetical protein C7I55_19520 [Sphingomonas deserti]
MTRRVLALAACVAVLQSGAAEAIYPYAVFFDPGSATLNVHGLAAVERAAEALRVNGFRCLEVVAGPIGWAVPVLTGNHPGCVLRR